MTRLATGGRPGPSTTPDTGRRVGLDRDAVIAAACALIERDGPDALTMRRLAADLDVTTTTLYWHVRNRDDVVAGVIDRVALEVATRTVTGDDPVDRVVDAARGLWDATLSRRAIAALAHQVGAGSRLHAHLELILLEEIHDAGLDGRDAVRALRAVLATVAGLLVVAIRQSKGTPLRSPIDAIDVVPPWMTSDLIEALASEPDPAAIFDPVVRAVVVEFLGSPAFSPRANDPDQPTSVPAHPLGEPQ